MDDQNSSKKKQGIDIIDRMKIYFQKQIVVKDFIIVTLFCLFFYIIVLFFFIEQILDGLKDNYSTIYGSMTQVTGGLLGFVVTGFSILTIASEKKILSYYKKAGLLDELIRLFKVTIYLLGIDTILNIVLLIINDPENLFLFFISLWLTFLIIFFIYRCVQVIVKLS